MSGEFRTAKEMSEIPIEGKTIEIKADPWLTVKIDGKEIFVGSVNVEWDGRTGEPPRPRVTLGISPRTLKFVKESEEGFPLAVLKVDNAPAIVAPTPSSSPERDNYLGYRNEFGIELPELGLRVKSNPAQFAELVARTQIEHGLAVVIDPAGPGERFAALVVERLGGRVRKMTEEVFVEMFNPDHLAEYLAGRAARRAYIREHEGRLARLGKDTTFVRYSEIEPRFELPGELPPIYAKGSRLVISEEGEMTLEYKQPFEHEELSGGLPGPMESDNEKAPEERSESQKQISELANFIMAEMPGEPSRDESAVECAIRLLKGGLKAETRPGHEDLSRPIDQDISDFKES